MERDSTRSLVLSSDVMYVFGFERLGVVVSDLYFLDPNPGPGQEGPERGVRMEIRFLEQQEQEGTIYASRPIVVDRPLWRADLLESVANPGSLDRAHHHPSMQGWEPGSRRFEPELSADPMSFVARQLEHTEELVEQAGLDPDDFSRDAAQIRDSSPEIIETVRRMLGRISRGELAREPAGASGSNQIRAGWL
jgi:hypothetical protein